MNERQKPPTDGVVRVSPYQEAMISAWANTPPIPQEDPFKPAEHPPGTLPSGVTMDDIYGGWGGGNGVGSWAWSQLQSIADFEYPRFIGFSALATLSQKAEYRRISETLATEMTRKWIKITAGSEEDKGDKVAKIEKAFSDLGVKDLFCCAAEHDGFFGRAHIFIDLGKNDDADELMMPIGDGKDQLSKTKVKKNGPFLLRNVEPVWVQPNDYNGTNPLDDSFYRPLTWYVQQKRVHESRLLTFVGRPVADILKPAYSFGGLSMTQIARKYVENWETTRDSVSSLVTSFSNMGIKTKLAEAMNAGADGSNLMRRIAMFTQLRNNKGTMVLDDDEEFFNVVTPLSTLDELQAQSQEHMASVSGIPIVKLLGISPHGLNASSEGEIRVFYDWIKSFQERFFRANLTKVLHFVQLWLFGEIDEEIGFQFEDLWSSSEVEKAQVRQSNAATDKTYIEGGVISSLEVRRKIARDHDMPYVGLELDDAPMLSETEKSENATKMATPILQAFSEGLIDKGQALAELVENGVFKTITEADVEEAKEAPPELNDELLTHVAKTKLERGGHLGQPQMPPGMPQPGGGGFGGPGGGQGAPPQQGGPAPPRQPPNLRVVGSDERPYDFGKLSQIDVQRLLAAIRDGDQDQVYRILSEREAYRPATHDAGMGFTVYHGSPYDFDHFDASKIGQGTGNAVFGTGVYTAENPDVAEWFRDELSDRADLAGKPLKLNAALTNITGHVYTVRVHRDRDEFVDWDVPIEEQTGKVRNGLTRALGSIVPGTTGRDIVKRLTPGKSKQLLASGVAGIRYKNHPARGSTLPGGGENYVLFDPDDATILEKDYEPIGETSKQNAKRGLAMDFDPGEARAPKGTSTGGQWTAGGAGSAEGEGDRISTRIPQKGKAEIPGSHTRSDLAVGLESSKANPKSFAKRAAIARSYLPKVAGETDEQTVERFIDHVKSNVLALHDAVPPEIAKRSKLWYDGAHKMASQMSGEYGRHPRAIAGVMAALSPQKDWFQNVSLAKRVLDTLRTQQDTNVTPKMHAFAQKYIAKTAVKNPDAAAALQKQYDRIKGKKLSELSDPLDKATFIRFYDEGHNSKSYPVVSPEGETGDVVKKGNGTPRRVTWGTFNSIAKAISVAENPDVENISRQMGGHHKVRNFYNNITSPQATKGDVTIDTHAIAGAHLLPLGGESAIVKNGLGTSGPKDAASGTKGLYGLYAEGYRRAAKDREVLPREMQSITWEAIRGLMGDDVKGSKGKAVQSEIKGIWDDYANGKGTRADAQKRLLAVNGGIKPPEWYRPDARANDQARHPYYAGELYRDQLGSGRAGDAVGGGRDGVAGVPPFGSGRDGRLSYDAEAWQNEPRIESGPGGGEWTSGGGGGAPAGGRHPKVTFKPNEPGEEAPAQLSWESAPGMTTKHFPEFHNAPLEQRREYQKAIEKVFADKDGGDVIASRLGLKTGPTFSAAGVFEGRVNPGAQGQVQGELSDDDVKKLNASEAIRALLLRQDAFAWHKPQLLPNGRSEPFLIPGLKTDHGTIFPTKVGEPLTHKDALDALHPDAQKEFIAAGKHNDDSNFIFKNDKGQQLSRVAARRYAESQGLLSDIGSKYAQPKLIAEHLHPDAATRHVRLDPKQANLLDFRAGRPIDEGEASTLDKALRASGLTSNDYALVPTPQGFRVLNIGDKENPAFRKQVVSAIENSEDIPDVDLHAAHYVSGYTGNNWTEHPDGQSYRETIGSAGPDVQRSADALLAELGPKVGQTEDEFAKKYGWTADKSTRPWETHVAEQLLQKNKGYPEGEAAVDAKAKEIVDTAGLTDRIAQIREQLKKAIPTNANVKDGGFKQDDGTYTPERQKLHEKILSKLFTPEAVKGATPEPGQRPMMTILGGRGGSGKSFITKEGGPVDAKKHIVADSDAFKQQLPEYKGWNAGAVHEESSDILDRAAEFAKAHGLNIVFDQTMKSGTSAPKRINQFKDTHDLQGYYVHATPETAAKRAMKRFVDGEKKNGQGRFVPPEYILGAHNNEANFDAVTKHFKRWAVYDNNAEQGKPKLVGKGENK
jgi:phage-related protein (TIGR01555 family)